MSKINDVTSAPSRGVGAVNETPNAFITTVKFDGSNYLPWFHLAQLYITGKAKLGYLTGETKLWIQNQLPFQVAG